MAKELKDIQKLIEEKAEKRFNNDYNKDVDAIQKSRLFFDVGDPKIFRCQRPSGREETTSAYFAFQVGYGIYEKLKAYWLPIYITKESEMFLADVERLKSDVDNLMNNQPNY